MINKKSDKVQFHYLQTFPLLHRTKLKDFIASLFRKEGVGLDSLDYIYCSDKYLLNINKEFLKHDFYTDIITFNLSESPKSLQGEIYISIDRVKDNAINFDVSFNRELHRVIFHGALHLCGYKDKTARDQQTMRKMEDKYLNQYFKKLKQ
jgi:rRNA maturation RNase YbeY